MKQAAKQESKYQRPTNLLGMIHKSREDANTDDSNEEVRLSATLRGHLRVILTAQQASYYVRSYVAVLRLEDSILRQKEDCPKGRS